MFGFGIRQTSGGICPFSGVLVWLGRLSGFCLGELFGLRLFWVWGLVVWALLGRFGFC